MLAAVILIAATVRLHGLGRESFWLDEEWSRSVADEGSLATAVRRVAADQHPPLYFAMLYAWRRLVGDSDVAVRLLSVLIGVATVGLLMLALRALAGWASAMAAGLLLSVNPVHLYWSQEARQYALLGFLAVALVHTALRWSDKPSPRRMLDLSAVAALMLYTHNYAVFFVVPTLAALAAMRAREPRVLASLAAGCLLVGLLYAPWLPSFLGQMRAGGAPYLAHHYPTLGSIPSVFAWYRYCTSDLLTKALTAALFGLLSGVGLWSLWRFGRQPAAALLAAITVGATFLAVVVCSVRGMWATKGLVPIGIITLGLLGVGISAFQSRALRVALISALTALFLCGVWKVKTSPLKEQWRQVASYVSAHWEPDDCVVVTAYHVAGCFLRYYEGPRIEIVLVPREVRGSQELAQLVGPPLRRSRRAWLIESHNTPYLRRYLESLGWLRRDHESSYVGIELRRYLLAEAPEDESASYQGNAPGSGPDRLPGCARTLPLRQPSGRVLSVRGMPSISGWQGGHAT
jgi:4-amino-4-deoxy-L-arabinose transferase-like glycosyltransferase